MWRSGSVGTIGKSFFKLVRKQKSYLDIDEAHALICCIICHGGNVILGIAGSTTVTTIYVKNKL